VKIKRMRASLPLKFYFVIITVPMLTFQKIKILMVLEAVEHLQQFGAQNWRSMSPKTHPAVLDLANDGQNQHGDLNTKYII